MSDLSMDKDEIDFLTKEQEKMNLSNSKRKRGDKKAESKSKAEKKSKK